jgi:hypothetical protein
MTNDDEMTRRGYRRLTTEEKANFFRGAIANLSDASASFCEPQPPGRRSRCRIEAASPRGAAPAGSYSRTV